MVNNLNVKQKLALIAIVTLFSVLALSTLLLFHEKEMIFGEKKTKLVNVVEMAYSLVEAEHKAFKSGAIDEEKAKQNAISAIKKLRYNGVDYVWVNDDVLPFPKMVMHPTVPSLDGKVLNADKFNCATSLEYGRDDSEIVATDGKKNLFQSFVEVANKSQFGFVAYNWPKPMAGGGTTSELYPKLSFVKKFNDWGMVLGSGVYVDDVQVQFYDNVMQVALYILAIIALLSLLFISVMKDITFKIGSFKEGLLTFFAYLSRESSEAKLIKIESKDEFGEMAKLINLNIQKAQRGVEEDRRLIDETRENLKEFTVLATTDMLSGLANRRSAMDKFEEMLALAKQHSRHMGVLMADIDYFKKVNDTYGHQVGDEVIKTVSSVLQENIRKSDLAARVGGEEFLMLFDNGNSKVVHEIAQRIRQRVEAISIKTADAEFFHISISLGFCSVVPKNETSQELLKRADDALYRAKKEGRNRVVGDVT